MSEVIRDIPVGSLSRGCWLRIKDSGDVPGSYARVDGVKIDADSGKGAVMVSRVMPPRIVETNMPPEQIVDRLPWNLRMPDLPVVRDVRFRE